MGSPIFSSLLLRPHPTALPMLPPCPLPRPPPNRFFFYFQARVEPDSEDTPVVLWMTGGPGCSSELAVFFENGALLRGCGHGHNMGMHGLLGLKQALQVQLWDDSAHSTYRPSCPPPPPCRPLEHQPRRPVEVGDQAWGVRYLVSSALKSLRVRLSIRAGS